MKKIPAWLPALVLLAVIVLWGDELLACPNCSRAVGDDDAAKATTVGEAYNYSIYLMMATPFLVLGTFGVGLYRSFSKALAAAKADWEGQQPAA